MSLAGPTEQIHILHQINFQVPLKETVSIVGPSGSGKTSLLMVIAGLEKASAGRVIVSGQDITNYSEDALAVFRREHIGIVFQNFHLIPTMSALENVAVPLEFAGNKNAFATAEEMLKEVGLSHRLHHLPNQLSGGEQQRVALARAFVMKPKLLLADEPTGNLDQENGRHIIELMFHLHEASNTTLLLITHDPELSKRCHLQVSMRNGRLKEGR